MHARYTLVFLSAAMVIGIGSAYAEAIGSREVVFSTLGPKGNRYENGGYAEDGQDSGPYPISIVFALTPKKNVGITELAFALTSQGGKHSFEVGFATSVNFRPGKIFYSSSIPNFRNYRCCNRLNRISVPQTPPVRLTGGTTYWLLVLADPDTKGGWLLSPAAKALRSISYDGGHTWTHGTMKAAAAFAIYGVPTGD